MGDSAKRRLALGAALLFVLGGSTSASGPANAGERPDQPSISLTSPPAARIASTSTTRRWSGSVNTNDKSAVGTAYLRNYAPGLAVPPGWTGNDNRCIAGDNVAASRAATLRALNFTRSLAGLAPVTFSSTLNRRSQLTALMMSANESLSHNPPRSWHCWTASGAANAARSNLALSYPAATSAGVITQYLDDAGSSNRPAGHRRWLLNPFATQMGSGSTINANAMTVVGPTSSSRPNPDYTSWPTSGWFPNTLEPAGRWSLSSGNRAVSFRDATVRVYRDGNLLKTVKNPVEDGYAMPTLVWQVPTSLAESGTFRVVVSGIRKSGSSQRISRSYYVRMFTPGS
jgi:uncharacterized protein YkwD